MEQPAHRGIVDKKFTITTRATELNLNLENFPRWIFLLFSALVTVVFIHFLHNHESKQLCSLDCTRGILIRLFNWKIPGVCIRNHSRSASRSLSMTLPPAWLEFASQIPAATFCDCTFSYRSHCRLRWPSPIMICTWTERYPDKFCCIIGLSLLVVGFFTFNLDGIGEYHWSLIHFLSTILHCTQPSPAAHWLEVNNG